MAARIVALAAASTLLGACALIVGIGDLPAPGEGDAGPNVSDAPAEGTSGFDAPTGPDAGGADARDAPPEVGDDARLDAPNDAADAPPGDGGPTQKKVFVTSGLFQSSMVATADDQCDNFAKLAGVSGRYAAWVSTDDQDAIAKLPTGNVEWRLLDANQTLVFAGTKEMTTLAQPRVPINVTEQKATLAVMCEVWTGTHGNGQRVANGTCGSWLLAGANGVTGDCTATVAWSESGSDVCGGGLGRLYCFEK